MFKFQKRAYDDKMCWKISEQNMYWDDQRANNQAADFFEKCFERLDYQLNSQDIIRLTQPHTYSLLRKDTEQGKQCHTKSSITTTSEN